MQDASSPNEKPSGSLEIHVKTMHRKSSTFLTHRSLQMFAYSVLKQYITEVISMIYKSYNDYNKACNLISTCEKKSKVMLGNIVISGLQMLI